MEYLQHDGQPGMRWGVRNGPPYPIDKAVRQAMASGQKAAISKTSSKVTSKVANRVTNKSDKLDIDGKKLLEEALITFGTVAAASLLSSGMNAGINYATSAGKMAIKNAMRSIGNRRYILLT